MTKLMWIITTADVTLAVLKRHNPHKEEHEKNGFHTPAGGKKTGSLPGSISRNERQSVCSQPFKLFQTVSKAYPGVRIAKILAHPHVLRHTRAIGNDSASVP